MGSRLVGVLLVAGCAVLGLALLLARDPSDSGTGAPDPNGAASTGHAAPTPAAAPAAEPPPALRIGAHGRMTLKRDELPEDAPLALGLEVPDDARPGVKGVARVLSTDGRFVEADLTPLQGAGAGVKIEIGTWFLTPGRYMIEIDTVEQHPLRIRRFVLEIR